MSQFSEISSRIDTIELSRIKNQFALRDRINSDQYEIIQREKQNPSVFFNAFSKPSDLSQSTMRGLKYPLELDGKGGLLLSSGYDRIGQQIIEVLETRLGERVSRPFFGIPEVLFESIDEYAMAQTIKSQLSAFLPEVPEIEVRVTVSEDGGAQVIVFYSVEGSESSMVKYSFSL